MQRLRQAVRDSIPVDSGFTTSEVVDKVAAALEEEQQDIIDAVAHRLYRQTLNDMVGDELHKRRRAARDNATNPVFQKRLEQATNGEKLGVRLWDTEYVVDEDNTRRFLRDFTKGDALFVAKQWNKRKMQAQLEESFMRQLARMIPEGQTLKDVADPERIDALYRGLVGGDG